MPKALAFTVLVVLTLSTQALAEPRCNCSAENNLPDCNPSQVHMTLKNDWIDVTVPTTDRCTHVDYRIDGEPFEIVVMDGHEREAWLGGEVKKITIDRCKFCQDTMYPDQTDLDEEEENDHILQSGHIDLTGRWEYDCNTIEGIQSHGYYDLNMDETTLQINGRLVASSTMLSTGQTSTSTYQITGTMTGFDAFTLHKEGKNVSIDSPCHFDGNDAFYSDRMQKRCIYYRK